MTNVVMPQMGGAIAEGTIVRWIKKVGDSIDRDEPLFEISTDKVDAEIPSPAAGVLTEIKVKEGETVAVNSIVATIGGTGEVVSDAPSGGGLPEAAVGQPESAERPASQSAQTEASEEDHDDSATAPEDPRRQKSSPLVRRIAQEHKVDITQIQGTGLSGRVTKQDILDYIAAEKSAAPAAAATRAPVSAPAPGPAYKPGENVHVVP